MNSLPVASMVAIGVFVAAITLGRWWLVHDTFLDRLVNRALAWDLGGLLLFCVLGRFGCTGWAFDLFTVFGCLAVANVFGFARLLDGADLATAVVRQRRYDTIAAVAGFITLASALAHGAGLSADLGPTVWQLTLVPTALFGLLVSRACIRELRTADPTVKERLIYAALLVVGGYSGLATVVGAVRTLRGTPPEDPGLGWVIGGAATLTSLTALIGIPLAHALLVRVELDRAGRCCRTLRPLWRDLTAAVPEVVLEAAHHGVGTRSKLYRMTVETRDALLQLRQYAPNAAVPAGIPEYAAVIARAIRAKAAGETPPAVPTGRGTGHSGMRDRTDELRYLLELARAWRELRSDRHDRDRGSREITWPRWPRRAPAWRAYTAPKARWAGSRR